MKTSTQRILAPTRRGLGPLSVLLTFITCAAFCATTSFAADKPAAEKAVAPTPPKSGVDTNDWVYLDNGQLRVGVKKSSGAGIAWFSKSKSTRNLINTFDRGRLIQQSYYGKEDGSMWDKQPWSWNPVQAGDWRGTSSKVLAFESGTNYLYSKTQPRHWATGADLPEVIMEQWLLLDGNSVQGQFKLTYSGKESHPARDQEIPAVFVPPDLDTLLVYDGDKPWSKGELNRSKPGWPNESRQMTERWAAYVDKNNFGIGVYVPVATNLTCYRFGDGKADPSACSYFAPVTKFAITPGKTFEYDLYLTLGTETEIRETIYKLRQQRGGPPGVTAPAAK